MVLQGIVRSRNNTRLLSLKNFIILEVLIVYGRTSVVYQI
jgi:hypothetical protein